MSNRIPGSGIGEFLQQVIAITGLLTSLAVFMNSLGGFIKLVQGDTGLVAKILLILLFFIIVVSWVICAYLYWKPTPRIREVGFSVTQPTSSQQSYSIRRRAFVGVIAIPILAAAILFRWQYFQSLPPKNIIVLVADFDGPNQEEYFVTKKIYKQLECATRNYSDVKIQRLNKPITVKKGSKQEDGEIARIEGKKRKATIVIWGSYGNTGEIVA